MAQAARAVSPHLVFLVLVLGAGCYQSGVRQSSARQGVGVEDRIGVDDVFDGRV